MCVLRKLVDTWNILKTSTISDDWPIYFGPIWLNFFNWFFLDIWYIWIKNARPAFSKEWYPKKCFSNIYPLFLSFNAKILKWIVLPVTQNLLMPRSNFREIYFRLRFSKSFKNCRIWSRCKYFQFYFEFIRLDLHFIYNTPLNYRFKYRTFLFFSDPALSFATSSNWVTFWRDTITISRSTFYFLVKLGNNSL